MNEIMDRKVQKRVQQAIREYSSKAVNKVIARGKRYIEEAAECSGLSVKVVRWLSGEGVVW